MRACEYRGTAPQGSGAVERSRYGQSGAKVIPRHILWQIKISTVTIPLYLLRFRYRIFRKDDTELIKGEPFPHISQPGHLSGNNRHLLRKEGSTMPRQFAA